MQAHVYKNPLKYSQNNQLQEYFAGKLIDKLSVNPNDRILDIGCGDGKITSALGTMAPVGCTIGTDISEEMITHATKTYYSQDNLKFVQMDAAKNIFQNQFDLVTSFNCLHWVKDQEKALQGISNALSENGRVALLLSHRKSAIHFVLNKVCDSPRWKAYFVNFHNPRSYFDIKEYQDLLIKVGLKVDSIVEEEMTYAYESEEKLKGYFAASIPHVKQIPLALKTKFISEVSNEFIKTVGVDNEGNIPLSYWCLSVTAHKPKLANQNTLNHPPARQGFFAKL